MRLLMRAAPAAHLSAVPARFAALRFLRAIHGLLAICQFGSCARSGSTTSASTRAARPSPAQRAGIGKRSNIHTLRHSFAIAGRDANRTYCPQFVPAVSVPMHDVHQLLSTLRGRYNQRELAQALGITTRTLRRWEVRETDPPPYAADAIRQRLLPLADSRDHRDRDFRFIDLFAGIGGIRMAFEAHGGHCVFTSEWNPYAQKTYLANFPESAHAFEGDITKVDERDIPNHDVLLAGFPCQPFSIAGVSKKNALGRAHGFADETQGTLFFDVARIIAAKRPAAFLLENVKNLVSHDKGHTFRVIKKVLEEELGYHITYKVVDGAHFVPQHRERILVVGFREKTGFSFADMKLPAHKPKLKEILHPQDGSEQAEAHYTVGPKAEVDARYTLTPKLWAYLQAYAEKHRAAGNGFGFGLVDGDSVTRTLSARYYKDGSEILVSQGPTKRPRRLTPRECARLMGLPDDFVIPVSDTQAYKQFGNSVVMPVMREVARVMKPRIMELIDPDLAKQKSLLAA